MAAKSVAPVIDRLRGATHAVVLAAIVFLPEAWQWKAVLFAVYGLTLFGVRQALKREPVCKFFASCWHPGTEVGFYRPRQRFWFAQMGWSTTSEYF